jgi:hypothetical protein
MNMPLPISDARISISPELPFNWKSLTKVPFKLNTESVSMFYRKKDWVHFVQSNNRLQK